ATLGATTGVLGGLVCAMIWRPEGSKGSASQPGPQQGGSQLVRRVMACGMAAVLVVGLLAGCGSDGGDDDSIGTGSEATLHGYCTALLRMNREVGSLAAVRASLDDKGEARESIAYLREVQDHAP